MLRNYWSVHPTPAAIIPRNTIQKTGSQRVFELVFGLRMSVFVPDGKIILFYSATGDVRPGRHLPETVSKSLGGSWIENEK